MRPDRLLLRLALAGLLALGLSACGRKGPLDPPPGASVARAPAKAEAAPPQEGVPAATPASKRRSPLDWFLE